MLLFITDVHCRYDIVNTQIRFAEERFAEPVEAAVILGDLGLFEPFLANFFRRAGKRFLRPVFFIEGNHEDFVNFAPLVRRYRSHLTHLPRGTVRTLAGQSCLFFGGAAYMDAHSTPESATIKPRDIDRCLLLPPDSVDLILSHDCPRGIGLANTPGFEHYGEPGFADGTLLARHFKPRFWLFGHHHRAVQYDHDGVSYIGLPQSWLGFAVMLADGHVRTVGNPTTPPPPPARPLPWWKRPRV